jgi:hypothetical protein
VKPIKRCFKVLKTNENSFSASWALIKVVWTRLVKWCFKEANGSENVNFIVNVWKNDFGEVDEVIFQGA